MEEIVLWSVDVSRDTDGHHHPSISTTVRKDSENNIAVSGRGNTTERGGGVCVCVRRSMQFTPPPRTIKPISAPSDVSNWPVALPSPCYSLFIFAVNDEGRDCLLRGPSPRGMENDHYRNDLLSSHRWIPNDKMSGRNRSNSLGAVEHRHLFTA